VNLKNSLKTRWQARLGAEVDPLFFAMACWLLISVGVVGKVMADELSAATDDVCRYFAASVQFPR